MKIESMEQLAEHMKKTVIPILSQQLKDEGNKTIAEAVTEAVTKNYEKLQKEAPWMDAIKQSAGGKVVIGRKEREKGDASARFIRAVTKCYAERRYTEGAVMDQLKSWGDEDLAEIYKADIEARQKGAMAATIPGDGGFLVPEQFSQDVVDVLRPQSVVRSLVGRTLQMPVGTINIPKITEGSSAYYQGENTNATKSGLKTGTIKMSWKKLISLVPMSNDLLRYSSPGADSIVRTDMVRAMAQRENQAFLRDTGTDAAPRGLRYQMSPANVLDVSTTTTTTQSVATDLGRCLLQLINANVPVTKGGWIFAPRTWNYLRMLQTTTGAFIYQAEMNSGLLLGYPYKWSTQVPVNLNDHERTQETEIYFADFDDVVIGEAMSLRVDASPEASYMDGGSLVSAYSQDQTVVRAITEHDFAVRRAESVMVLNGVKWGA